MIISLLSLIVVSSHYLLEILPNRFVIIDEYYLLYGIWANGIITLS